MKPRLFIGSSTESVEIAYTLQEMLESQIEITVWDQGIFEPSDFILEDIVEKMQNFDFAAFIFSPDDAIKIRGDEQNITRDNVIFELGLFIGKLGRKNNFIIVPNNNSPFRIPSDLLGLNYIPFNANRQDKNLHAALGPVKNKILSSVTKRFTPKTEEDSKENDQMIVESEGELYEEYRLMLNSSINQVYFIVNQREWIFPLVISITAARKRGLNIFVAYYYTSISEKDSVRLRLLTELGCHVVAKSISEKPPFLGVISNPSSKNYSKLIVQPNSEINKFSSAKKYLGTNDYEFIELAYGSIKDLFTSKDINDFKPKIEKISFEDLKEKMKNVPFYQNCTFELRRVQAQNLIPLTKYVRAFKLNQIDSLVLFYEETNLDLFEPCCITTKNGENQALIPPVLEEYNGKLYIAEGHTRTLHCLNNKIDEFYALVVKGCKNPMASKPNKWENVKIAYKEAKTHAVYEGRKFELARRIETFTHWIKK